MRSTLGPVLLVVVAGVAVAASACSAGSHGVTFGSGGGSSQGTASGNPSGTSSSGNGGGLGLGGGVGSGTGGGSSNNCNAGLNEDHDHDGWTIAQGDCNDCDPNVNPGAIDTVTMGPNGPVLGNEDCGNKPGNVPKPCDDGLAVDDPDPMNAAKAVELCTKLTDPKKWGVKSAKWVLPDGSPPPAVAEYDLGHGILSAFGSNVNVQAGKRMLGLSSGTARQPTDPGYQDVGGFDKGYTCGSPMGFPKESPACPGVTTGTPHDGVGLELKVVAPTNAHGFSFSFNFFTYEWPDFICSTFNDFFVALLSPIPMGQTDGNISFDSLGNPVSVNNAFLEVCGCANGPPCTAGGKNFTCALGDQKLLGTGFGMDTTFGQDHGSTYWLQTKAPIQPHEEITIRWAVYDSGDGILDTTTLVDNWQWIATPGTTVGTSPIPMPK